jgi:hypothetical protein
MNACGRNHAFHGRHATLKTQAFFLELGIPTAVSSRAGSLPILGKGFVHKDIEMARPAASRWLQSYYFARAAFSVAWVAAAFTIGKSSPPIAALLLVAYPAWDAFANVVDARQSGGLLRNPSQSLNVVVSVVTATAVAIALSHSMNAVLGVFGVWAGLSGILQLATGLRRWTSMGGQWAMILSGAQSALASVFMLKDSFASAAPSITRVAPYAGFGAFYFLVSAVLLTIALRRGSVSFGSDHGAVHERQWR